MILRSEVVDPVLETVIVEVVRVPLGYLVMLELFPEPHL
jgi:hypothetical protein